MTLLRWLSTLEYMQGVRLPWWQGVAYHLWDRDVAVCAPIPFNLLIRWTRNTYFWVKATSRPDWLHAQQQLAYEHGWADRSRQPVSAREFHAVLDILDTHLSKESQTH